MSISFDDFKKCDIRIGTIISAERIPEGDKLLKLVVDFGTEQRQIISGIARVTFDPALLVGKQVPVLINLEPRILLGHESEGMMLSEDKEGVPILLHPAEGVPPGSFVK